MRGLVYLVFALTSAGAAQGADLPKVLFFANPMASDNDVIRRPRPDTLSVAERHFSELSKGVFDVTITQDGAEVTPEKLARYQAVVFFTAINPPGVDKDGLIEWVQQGRRVRRHPFHGQHLPEPSRVRRDARRIVRPAAVADQGESADEGPGAWSRTGRIRRRGTWGSRSRSPTIIYQFKNFDRSRCSCCSAWTRRAST